jgi:hypothetical protein
MKTLVIDIESQPSLAFVWQLFQTNVGINQVEIPGSVICFAAKWVGEKKIHFYSDFHDGHSEMVKRAWTLLDEADAIVTYNGRAYDCKHLQREFLMEGLGKPSPHIDIDLLLVMRKNFKFASNKLDFIAQQLDLGSKTKHAGFDLWRGCMEYDARSWSTMKKYNIQDVRLTEELFEVTKEWNHMIPNHALHGHSESCPRCGSGETPISRGFSYNKTSRHRRYQCRECRGYFSERIADKEEAKPLYK